jgi:hypothetical protein
MSQSDSQLGMSCVRCSKLTADLRHAALSHERAIRFELCARPTGLLPASSQPEQEEDVEMQPEPKKSRPRRAAAPGSAPKTASRKKAAAMDLEADEAAEDDAPAVDRGSAPLSEWTLQLFTEGEPNLKTSLTEVGSCSILARFHLGSVHAAG